MGSVSASLAAVRVRAGGDCSELFLCAVQGDDENGPPSRPLRWLPLRWPPPPWLPPPWLSPLWLPMRWLPLRSHRSSVATGVRPSPWGCTVRSQPIMTRWEEAVCVELSLKDKDGGEESFFLLLDARASFLPP